MEKLLLEACIEAMHTGAVVAIQDMGAAGLTCSTMEMASRGGTGIEIDLAKVPQRESGMTPYEIMLSESQERMLLVAEKGREQRSAASVQEMGTGRRRSRRRSPKAASLRVQNHGEDAARDSRRTRWPKRAPSISAQSRSHHCEGKQLADWFAFKAEGRTSLTNFTKLLASPAIASKQWITEQYDTMVRTNTLAGPGASDAAVIRIKDPQTGEVKRALALSTDGNGRWCQLNPRLARCTPSRKLPETWHAAARAQSPRQIVSILAARKNRK